MTSNINTSGINSAFPYAGQDNPSNGFRTNWAQISNNLNIAHDEITALQNQVGGVTANLTLTLAGDVIAPTTVIPGGATMTTTLKSRGIGTQTYDSTKQDISLSVNDSGIITGFTIKNSSTSESTSYPISFTTVSTSNGSSVSKLVLPEFSVSPNGKIVSSDNKTVNFGLLGFGLKQGSVIVGNANNQSDLVSPTAAKQVLLYDGTNTTFKSLSITDFADVNFTGATTGQVLTYNGTKWIPETVQSESGFNPNSIKVKTSIPSDASFIISETDSNRNVTLESVTNSTMLSYINSNINFKLVNDKSPQLGGTLDLNGKNIISSTSAAITIGESLILHTGQGCNVIVGTDTMMNLTSTSVMISSDLFSIVSGGSNIVLNSGGLTLHSNTSISGSLSVNGVQYPSTLPASTGMFLSCDNTGKTSWAAPSLSSTFARMETTGTGTKNSDLMIYDPTTSTSNLIPASSLLVPFKYNKYYVSQMGNDSTGDGSIIAPFKTINGVMNYFSSHSSVTFPDVEIIFDAGAYNISSVTIPTNITNLYFSTINGKNSKVAITCLTGSFVIPNNGFYASNIEFSGNGIITSDVKLYNCTFSGGGSISFQSKNSSSLLFDSCELNMNGGNISVYGYSSVNVVDVIDFTKVSTLSFGKTTGTETCNYILSGSNIGNFNVYSGNLYANSCEFYQSFTSKLDKPNILSINNCNFVDYAISGSAKCSLNYINSVVGFFNNNNRYLYSTTNKVSTVKSKSYAHYDFTYSLKELGDVVINLNADIVVVNIHLSADNIQYDFNIDKHGTQYIQLFPNLRLHFTSDPNISFMCSLIIVYYYSGDEISLLLPTPVSDDIFNDSGDMVPYDSTFLFYNAVSWDNTKVLSNITSVGTGGMETDGKVDGNSSTYNTVNVCNIISVTLEEINNNLGSVRNATGRYICDEYVSNNGVLTLGIPGINRFEVYCNPNTTSPSSFNE